MRGDGTHSGGRTGANQEHALDKMLVCTTAVTSDVGEEKNARSTTEERYAPDFHARRFTQSFHNNGRKRWLPSLLCSGASFTWYRRRNIVGANSPPGQCSEADIEPNSRKKSRATTDVPPA